MSGASSSAIPCGTAGSATSSRDVIAPASGAAPARWPGSAGRHRAPDPAQAGQDPLVLEPARRRRGGAAGSAGGWWAGWLLPGSPVAHQRVHQCRLARPGGTADDGEQRGIQAAVARAGCSRRAGRRALRMSSRAAPAPGSSSGSAAEERSRGQLRSSATAAAACAFCAAGSPAVPLVRSQHHHASSGSAGMPGPAATAGSGQDHGGMRGKTKNGPGLLPGTGSLVTPAGFEPALPP